jgi:hypothetical protein
LSLYNTSVSGDISGWDVSGLTGNLFLFGTDLDYDSTGGALAGFTANNRVVGFYDCNLTQTQVDNVLVDLDSSGTTGGTLTLNGTNAAPSATGLTAKTNLEGKDWTVTVSS